MELLLPGPFDDPGTAYAYQRTIFEEVTAGERPATVSITPSTHHVGVTRRDTLRPGFSEAVQASYEEGYPVLARGAGGGATAASRGTFGFSIIRSGGDTRRGIGDSYGLVAALVPGAYERLGGKRVEIRVAPDQFWPG